MSLLISIENGFSSRYILRTGILEALRRENIPVTVAAPNPDEPYLREWLDTLGVRVIGQPQLPYVARSLRTKLEQVRFFGFPDAETGSNIDVKYRLYLAQKPMRPPLIRSYELGVQIHRKIPAARAALTQIGRLYDVSRFRGLLLEHGVRLLVLDGLENSGPNVSGWARAAYGNCRTVTVVTNWDHPTTKGYRSIPSQCYLVWGRAMQDELERYHDLPSNRIERVGSALFDLYARPGSLYTRACICERFGLDERRPIFLYVANSPVNFPDNADIVAWLTRQLGTFSHQPQLLIRLHPLFQKSSATELAQYQELARCPGIAVSTPRVLSQRLFPDMDFEELRLSASLVRAADVVVNFFSTMQLDACICDKPVINIAFDWSDKAFGSQQAGRFKGYTHIRRVVDQGATELARNRVELRSQLENALERPKERSAARQRVVQSECGVVDGKSAERIAEAIVRQYWRSVSARGIRGR